MPVRGSNWGCGQRRRATAPHRRRACCAPRKWTVSFCRDGRWRITISGTTIRSKFWFWAKQAAAMVYGDAQPMFRLCGRVEEDGKLIDRLQIRAPEVQAGYLSYLLGTEPGGSDRAGGAAVAGGESGGGRSAAADGLRTPFGGGPHQRGGGGLEPAGGWRAGSAFGRLRGMGSNWSPMPDFAVRSGFARLRLAAPGGGRGQRFA